MLVRHSRTSARGVPTVHAVIAASLLGSCAEEPPGPLETKYARIYTTDYEGPLCAGDAAHVDRRIEMLAARFSTVAPIDLQIHIGLLPPDECGKSTFGCFDPAGNTILTHWDSLDHELVHAVAAQVEWRGQMPLRPFWQEGIAEAYDGERSRRSGSVLAEYPKTSSAELSYSTAGHFAAWVREEHGDEAIEGILRGEDEAEIFGTPVENLVAQYEAEAPWLIPGRNFCAGPQLEVEDVLSFSRRITCEDAATSTLEEGEAGFELTLLPE